MHPSVGASHGTAIISVHLSLLFSFEGPRRPSFADHGNLRKSQLPELRAGALDPLPPTHFELPPHWLLPNPDLLGLASWLHFLQMPIENSGRAACNRAGKPWDVTSGDLLCFALVQALGTCHMGPTQERESVVISYMVAP